MTKKEALLSATLGISAIIGTTVLTNNDEAVLVDEKPIAVVEEEVKPIEAPPKQVYTMTYDDWNAYIGIVDKEGRGQSFNIQDATDAKILEKIEEKAQNTTQTKSAVIDGETYTATEYELLEDNLILKKQINGQEIK